MLNSKQRASLRSMATELSPIIQIGKSGITENLIKTVSDALEARELIKLTVLENCDQTPKEAAEVLADETSADVVAVVGRKVVLYRKSEKNKKIEI